MKRLDDFLGLRLQRTNEAVGLGGRGRHDLDPLALPAAGGLPGADGPCSGRVPFSAICDDHHLAHEHVRFRPPLLIDLDAELGAQVGDDGGGSADGKQWIVVSG